MKEKTITSFEDWFCKLYPEKSINSMDAHIARAAWAEALNQIFKGFAPAGFKLIPTPEAESIDRQLRVLSSTLSWIDSLPAGTKGATFHSKRIEDVLKLAKPEVLVSYNLTGRTSNVS